MTEPTDEKPATKGRLILNLILLVLNLIICFYFFQYGRLIFFLLFLLLALRNAYLVYTAWQERG